MSPLCLESLPTMPGTYVLVMRLNQPAQAMVGRLGTLAFVPGIYLYVGSAHGPGGLRARVGRHLRREKAPHWHIDRLTVLAPVTQVWFVVSTVRLECHWAQRLAALSALSQPAAGFGASDCRCHSHLFHAAVDAHSDLFPVARDALGNDVAICMA